jgi:hypothetical protein
MNLPLLDDFDVLKTGWAVIIFCRLLFWSAIPRRLLDRSAQGGLHERSRFRESVGKMAGRAGFEL